MRFNCGREVTRFVLFIVLMTTIVAARRGPHHPHGSEISRKKREHAQEHLEFKPQHIEEDLQAANYPLPDKKPEDMSEDEKNYLYFKVHDLDGNDKLDGLEIFYSATHHSSKDDHNHDGEASSLPLLDRDENGEITEKGVNHIVDVLDNFLDVADLDQDGFLNYAEYAEAVKLGNAMAHADAEVNHN